MKQILYTSLLTTTQVSLVECFTGSLQGLPPSGFSGLFLARFIVFLPLILVAASVYHFFLKEKLQTGSGIFNRLMILISLAAIIISGLFGWAFIDSQIFNYRFDSSPFLNVYKIFLKNYGSSIPVALLIAVILPLLYGWVSLKTSKQ